MLNTEQDMCITFLCDTTTDLSMLTRGWVSLLDMPVRTS